MVYKWQGFSHKVDAQTVGEELEKIIAEKGAFTPKDLVDRARSDSSPIHNLFEWDDRKAAEAHREHTAAQVICCLVVVKEESKPQKVYVNIVEKAPTKQGLYVTLKKAMEDNRSREVVLRNALGELNAFRHKYSTLSELADVFREIDKAVEKAEAIREKRVE